MHSSDRRADIREQNGRTMVAGGRAGIKKLPARQCREFWVGLNLNQSDLFGVASVYNHTGEHLL